MRIFSRRNHRDELATLISNAEENGWTYIGNDTVRRLVDHEVGEEIRRAGWWTGETCASVEYLSFVFPSLNRQPYAVYSAHTRPWRQREDTQVTYRRAVELLDEPIYQSAVHNR